MDAKKSRGWFVMILALGSLSCNIVSAPLDGSAGDLDSGIEGLVVRGPMCPVELEGEPCSDEPFRATFYVFDGREKEVARFETDEDGRFRLALPPGTYAIVPDASAPLMQPEHQRESVDIEKGRITDVVLHFDTGIR